MRAAALLILASLCACATTYPITLRPPLTQPPLVERYPVTVEVGYADTLKNHRCVLEKGYIYESWIIELGPPSLVMFDQIFAALFERVVANGAPGDARQALPRIEIDLANYDGCEATWPIVGTGIAVTYEATFLSADGSELARWQATGQAEPGADITAYGEDYGLLSVESRYLGAMTRLAMREAAADFITRFDSDPRMRTWLGR